MNASRFAYRAAAALCALAANVAVAQLPPGSYTQSCPLATIGFGNVLIAKCKNNAGATVAAMLQLPCAGSVDNVDGKLACNAEVTINNKSTYAFAFWVGPNDKTRYKEDCIEAGKSKVLKVPAQPRYVGMGYAVPGCSGTSGSGTTLNVAVGQIALDLKDGKASATVWSTLAVHDEAHPFPKSR